VFSTSTLLTSVLSTTRRHAGAVFLVALSATSPCRAQSVTLALSSGSAPAGGTVTLDLSLSAPTVLPAAVHWTLAYSAVDFGSPAISAGPAAIAASKQLSCSNQAGSTTCLLWGQNTAVVTSGVLAIVTLPINYTSDASSQLQLTISSAADALATDLGTSNAGGTVTIKPGLHGFSCFPVSFPASTSTSCTITLTAAAPTGGATIDLSSNPTSAVTAPASVTFPPGSLTGSFNVTAGNVTVATPVMLTASYLGVLQGFGVTVNPSTSNPSISSLSPTSAALGASVTITGTNFGGSQGASTVKFNGTAAAPTSWNATTIVAPVPTGASSGNVVVTVGGAASNGVAFTVLSSSASFVKRDTTTQGNWPGAYGSEGYTVVGGATSNPAYVTPVPAGQSQYVWAPSTSDVRALQAASNPANRVAGTWYTSSFTVDLNIADNNTHQVAVYCLDWDSTARRQTVDILDGNGNVLNTQNLTSSFNGGVYLVWNVSGHVKIRVTRTGGDNAVLSGLFLH
jgi:hypothetical protein